MTPDGPLPLTPLSLAILMALADGELHGYGIMKAIQQQSDGHLRAGAGSLYAALDRMERTGWIAEKSGIDAAGETQRRFAITRAGRSVARAEAVRLAAVLRQARQQKLLPEGS
ncbi:MAG: helix-turn-helix transcriptional regulator [Gemmatimonadota bacterium]